MITHRGVGLLAQEHPESTVCHLSRKYCPAPSAPRSFRSGGTRDILEITPCRILRVPSTLLAVTVNHWISTPACLSLNLNQGGMCALKCMTLTFCPLPCAGVLQRPLPDLGLNECLIENASRPTVQKIGVKYCSGAGHITCLQIIPLFIHKALPVRFSKVTTPSHSGEKAPLQFSSTKHVNIMAEIKQRIKATSTCN